MRPFIITVALIVLGTPAFAQTGPTPQQQPRNVQQVMRSIGADWQAKQAAENHVVAGLEELQNMAADLETKNRALTGEVADLKKKLEECSTDPTKCKVATKK